MTAQTDSDVIIIGCGPTGAVLALLLAKQGRSVTIIEREAAIYPLPRAVHIDDEIMRIFQSLGLADAIAPYCHPGSTYDFRNATGETLLSFATNPDHRPLGWLTSNMIYQPGIEAELQSAIVGNASITLMRGWSFTALEDTADGINVTITDGDVDRVLTASYVVGCDGARSPVRMAMGGEVDDLQFREPWLVIDTVLTDPDRLHAGGLQVCDPARPTTSVRVGPLRHRWEFMLHGGETAEHVSTDEFISALLKPWGVDGIVTIERRAVYQFEAIIAKAWRVGRVMLAGDAAHQMPPFAGQGMCSGLRDAANLAWKLDAVLSGVSTPDLLDSYQIEREPNVRGIIDMALMMGQTVCITDPVIAAHRDAKMLADRASGTGGDKGGFDYPPILRGIVANGDPQAGRRFPQPVVGSCKLDDVLGDGAWLIMHEESAPPTNVAAQVKTVSLADARLAPFSDHLNQWMANHGNCTAVLVRADRYVFGAGDADTLMSDYAGMLHSGNQSNYGAVPISVAA